MTAQQVMFVVPVKVALKERELPTPVPGQGALRALTLTTVISPGTELAYLHQLENARWPLPGFKNGSCYCGIVSSLGESVADLAVGQGVVAPLGHASAGVLDAGNCHLVPETLAAEHAASLEGVELGG